MPNASTRKKRHFDRYDSGMALFDDQPARDPDTSGVMDLFQDDFEDLFTREDVPCNLAPENDNAMVDDSACYISTALIISMIDAALRTILGPRPFKIDPVIKVKKSKDFVRLDELAPAICKPNGMRALAMHSTFAPRINTILNMHKQDSGNSDAEGTCAFDRQRILSREVGLWHTMFRKLLKDAPGVRLAPVRILVDGGDTFYGGAGDDLFGDGEMRLPSHQGDVGLVEDLFALQGEGRQEVEEVSLVDDGLDLLWDGMPME
ncbi:hypothetical protein CAC42_6533 [Sphaceloma murrayae]|uniref:Uncharacterized protein n=1 Tax=Sphaceloma murrayae TaxID=2082308 RepID=A0A2K1QGL1_9PEZI|nr:hypothetical protein CAC42_6533 [Sphaceloma murrayae]